MKFIKKNTFIKFEAEYESPSGEKYECEVCVESDRHTVSWRKVTDDNKTDFITIDGEMLNGLFDLYQELVLKGKKTHDKGLQKPNVVDHRKMIESFSPSTLNSENDAASFRTGLNVEELGELPETPDNLKIDNDDDSPAWKKDVKHRLSRSRKSFRDIV